MLYKIAVDKLLVALALIAGLVFPPAGAGAATYIVNGAIVNGPAGGPRDDVKIIEYYSPDYNRYTDNANGYSILYPAPMVADVSASAVRTVFADDKTRIEVYYDNLTGTSATAWEYIHYSNKFVTGAPEHAIRTDTWLDVNGCSAHLLEWTRRPLARLPGDKNHYACAEIIKNDYEVYTVFIKSSEPLDGALAIIGSLTFEERRGGAVNRRTFAPSATKMNAETRDFFHRYFAGDSPLRWGVFEPSAPNAMSYLAALEAKLDFEFPFLLHYQMLDEYFPARGLQSAYDGNKYVELTLQTVYSGEANALWAGSNRNASMVYDILDGKYDDYFTDYACRLKDFGHPVVFRFNNEMNGDWCWYSAFYTGKDTELYKAMWRYIHDIFERNGVDNVVWVWNPHDLSLPAFKWNHYLMYYPGDEYVDIIGLTGYNTGTYFDGEQWREFDDIYTPLYREYGAAFDKPFMITEFAASSVGGDKAAWINRMFDNIRKFDRIKVAVWWSGVDYDRQGRPGRIYLLDEDEAVVSVFRDRLKEYKH